MNDWNNSKLGRVSAIITGPFGSQLHSYEYVDSGIPVIMPQNIDNRTFNTDKVAYINEETARRLKRYVTIENDIVYSRRGDIEKHAFIKKEQEGAICGTGCFRVRITDKTILPLFLSFFLNRPETRLWLVQHAVGSNMPNLNTEILADVPISYPDLTTQKSIADILYAIDRKIALNNAINAELENMARLLYDYWFVQFDFPDENGKPYKSSGGAMVRNEQLKKEIPVGWDETELLKVCKFISGFPFSSEDYVSNGKYRIITIKNVQDNGVNLDVDNFLNKLPERLPNDCALKIGDILMSLTGNVGRVGLMYTTDCLLNQRVALVKPVDKDYHGFSYLAVKSCYVQGIIQKMASGSSQANLSPVDTGKIRIAFDANVAAMFSKQTKPIIDKILNCLQQNIELIELRDFLLPLLMNGQVAVG